MSKWGNEESETLSLINNTLFLGNVLDVAAGDGRFLNALLEKSKSVTTIDISSDELNTLKTNCPKKFMDILKTEVVDITKRFPYQDETYDTIFCTGTLHLFDKNTISFILDEMKRCLKKDGIIIFDFATDIKRLDINKNEVLFEGEGNYNKDEAISLIHELLKDCYLDIEILKFAEDNLDKAGYNSIEGNFLLVKAKK